MALAFRRPRPTDARETIDVRSPDAQIVRALHKLADRGQTGAVRVEDGWGNAARIYAYLGEPYAVAIDGFTPHVGARLRSAGLIDDAQCAVIPASPDAGRELVSRTWVTATALGAVHQEFMLAAFGSVITAERPSVEVERDAVTDAYCTLPVSMEPLLESVRVRAERMVSTWSVVASGASPASVGLRTTGTPLPPSLSQPEFAALVAAVQPDLTIDAVASAAGFTRAEAVHLVGILMAAHVLDLAETHSAGPAHSFLVPEEFGHRAVTPHRLPDRIESASDEGTDTGGPASVSQFEVSQHEASQYEDSVTVLRAQLAEAVDEQRTVSARIERLQAELGEALGALERARGR